MASSNSVLLSVNSELSKKYRHIAQNELHEKEKHTDAHVTSFRRWLQSMPHLKCPDDDRLFVAFLRQSKFDHSKAQCRLDNFITLRCSEHSSTKKWFDRPDMSDPLLEEYLNSGIHIPIGYTEDGGFLLLVRMGQWNPDRIPTDRLLQFMTMQIDRILEDPRVQIAGLRVLFDMKDANSKQMSAMNPRKNGKEMMKLFQEAYPVRMKAFIYYNEPPILDMLIKFMTHWMKPKLKERIFRLKDNIELGYKKIPGLKAILPKEYGGDSRSIEEMKSEQNSDFLIYHSGKNLWTCLGVDESKRPEAAKFLMKEYKDYDERLMGTTGTIICLPDED